MARIAIVGAGAIGGVTAALLQQAGGHELLLCTRRPMSRLSVETPEGFVTIQAAFVTEPKDAFAVDWVMVATKAYDARRRSHNGWSGFAQTELGGGSAKRSGTS